MKNQLIALILLAVAAMVSAFRGLRLAANTYDAAVETHESSVTRTNDAAITARHLLWKKGAGDGTVAIAGVADIPLGPIDNITTGTGERQSVALLGKGSTKKMVASAAIAVGVRVFTAANGKVRALPVAAGDYPCVGIALTAATDDNHIIEVQDCVPFLVTVS
jgi:hypothetical protein